MKSFNVYGGNLDGKYRVIAACSSITAFCKLTGVARGYATMTGNAEECTLALAEPGVIFARLDSFSRDRGYRRIEASADLTAGLMYRAFTRKAVREAFEAKGKK